MPKPSEELTQNLREALSPAEMAREMGFWGDLTDADREALETPEQMRGAYGALSDFARAIADAWECQYGPPAERRAACERACREHSPKYRGPEADEGLMVRGLTVEWLQAVRKWKSQEANNGGD